MRRFKMIYNQILEDLRSYYYSRIDLEQLKNFKNLELNIFGGINRRLYANNNR